MVSGPQRPNVAPLRLGLRPCNDVRNESASPLRGTQPARRVQDVTRLQTASLPGASFLTSRLGRSIGEALRRAKENLFSREMRVVGVMDDMPAFYADLAAAWPGLQEAAVIDAAAEAGRAAGDHIAVVNAHHGSHSVLSPEDRSTLHGLLAADFELYRWAKTRSILQRPCRGQAVWEGRGS